MKTLEEKYLANERWELSGLSAEECPPPYPELLHGHLWSEETDYCLICGTDGRA